MTQGQREAGAIHPVLRREFSGQGRVPPARRYRANSARGTQILRRLHSVQRPVDGFAPVKVAIALVPEGFCSRVHHKDAPLTVKAEGERGAAHTRAHHAVRELRPLE